MKTYRFEIIMAALFLALFVVLANFHAPGKALSQSEVDSYISNLEQNMPWPAEEKPEIMRHLRAWAEADDGKPVYMLNLMRYYKQLKPLPQLNGLLTSN